jgi:hypothetical protein
VLLDVFLEVAVRHVFQRQDVAGEVPVLHLHEPGVRAESLVDLRFNRHFAPAVGGCEPPCPRGLDDVS